ncbi:MAG: acyl-CoA carboxylase subunit beta [Planctomycetes bacterium]|nr:acyl-CoA carboxylase subunit beta [Planctomycetota bacterium]
MTSLRELTTQIDDQEQHLRLGGGVAGQERQRRLGRLPVRERLAALLDPQTPFYELGLWGGWGMYSDWGEIPAAGVVTGIGNVHGRSVIVVANDATVKAGAMFPQSVKKVLRAQQIATDLRLPLIYLVDSAGVFLPLQEDIFPDEQDFGRIFRNNAVISAMGIPQYSAVMGNCVAGGAYLPVLSDTLLMTEGSALNLAGPALVKAAIGQTVDPEDLGGARMHAEISGTVDFREADDPACLRRLRSLIELLPPSRPLSSRVSETKPIRDPDEIYRVVPDNERAEFDVRDLLACVVDADSMQEFRADYGTTLVTTYAKIGGRSVGIVANQCRRCKSATGELQIGGVLYTDSAEKGARFVMECNQSALPIVFLQNVQGFMVGRQSEQAGIIRSGAKLVNVVSNSVVPKLTVVIGGSFGAGNYALCGRAYDPVLMLAWPGARYAVMGADQSAETLLSLRVREAERDSRTLSDEDRLAMREDIRQQYIQHMDIRYGAARGWVDAIIAPHTTRDWLSAALCLIPEGATRGKLNTGMLQM